MSDDRKKPLWSWIVALLIGLPVLYALSYGPWIYFQYAVPVPAEVVDAGNSIFMPLEQLAMNGRPNWLMIPYRTYLTSCAEMANGPELIYR
jgi:hypothetical protein